MFCSFKVDFNKFVLNLLGDVRANDGASRNIVQDIFGSHFESRSDFLGYCQRIFFLFSRKIKSNALK